VSILPGSVKLLVDVGVGEADFEDAAEDVEEAVFEEDVAVIILTTSGSVVRGF
jgi:hypothetical protein